MHILSCIISVSWMLWCVCGEEAVSLTTRYTIHPSRVGVGTTLQNVTDVSVLSCGIGCSREERCDAAIYFPSHRICVMLQDGRSDWEMTQEGLYLGPNSEGW